MTAKVRGSRNVRTIEQRTYNSRKRKRKKRRIKPWVVFCMILAVFLCAAVWLSGYPHHDYTGLQIAYNRTAMRRSTWSINYIVIHDTANPNAGADARQHFAFFNSGDQESSADFFVDSQEALQVNDYYRYYTWHCGDGGAEAKIKNRNSIGIEICVNSDGDYSAAVQRAAVLTRQLMQELHIDIDHVVRHRDASGKDCPGSMSEADWLNFKAMVLEA